MQTIDAKGRGAAAGPGGCLLHLGLPMRLSNNYPGNTLGGNMESFSNYRIVKQPNGKYAMYNTETKEFTYSDRDSPEAIIELVLRRVRIRLEDNAGYYSKKPDHFDICVRDYKYAHGILSRGEPDPHEEYQKAVAELRTMGVETDSFRWRCQKKPFRQMFEEAT
ncbi:MAG: hypothetical protein MI892_24680 [Desulfobacterales bacterium]|nr:hypothetical protein [Desulfobacterales bacterium]